MKKLALYICVLMGMPSVFGQELQLPSGNQYLADSEFLIMPTYAGIGNNVRVRLSATSQWVGLKEAPDYQSLSGDMRLGNRSGLGLSLYNDRNGYTKQMGAKTTFSHHLTLDSYDSHFVSFGISYLVNAFRIDIDQFNRGDNITPLDPAVTDNRSTVNHNFEVGILYRYKGIFASLAATNILNKNKEMFDVKEPTTLRNYNLYAGYRYKRTPSSILEIEPSVFVQYREGDGRSFTDANVKFRWFDFEDYYWVGATARFVNDQAFKPLSVGPMLGLKKGVFYFAYGYNLNLNTIRSYNSGSHMITLGIDMFQGIGGCNCTER